MFTEADQFDWFVFFIDKQCIVNVIFRKFTATNSHTHNVQTRYCTLNSTHTHTHTHTQACAYLHYITVLWYITVGCSDWASTRNTHKQKGRRQQINELFSFLKRNKHYVQKHRHRKANKLTLKIKQKQGRAHKPSCSQFGDLTPQ